MNRDGGEVESWTESNSLALIHDARLAASLNSGRWKKGYNLELTFSYECVSHHCLKKVSDAIMQYQTHNIDESCGRYMLL